MISETEVSPIENQLCWFIYFFKFIVMFYLTYTVSSKNKLKFLLPSPRTLFLISVFLSWFYVLDVSWESNNSFPHLKLDPYYLTFLSTSSLSGTPYPGFYYIKMVARKLLVINPVFLEPLVITLYVNPMRWKVQHLLLMSLKPVPPLYFIFVIKFLYN